jgi:hypothetical protein
MLAETPTLPESFLASALRFENTDDCVRWYMCTIITLSSLNYPDVIPQVYQHFDEHVLSRLESSETRAKSLAVIREGLIKSTGIVGAARTGNAMRKLSDCTPEVYRESESLRSKETEQVAQERGRKFWLNIYSRNPDFDPEKTVRASPDYAFVVRGTYPNSIISAFRIS